MDSKIIPESCTRVLNLLKAFGEDHVKGLMESSDLDVREPGDFLTLEEELEILAEKAESPKIKEKNI